MALQINTMEDAAKAYRKIEAKLEAIEEEAKAKALPYKQAMEQVETIMLSMMNTMGAKSIDIPGVAEVKATDKRTFGGGDWDSFFTWLVLNNKPELLQKRIHDGNMQHYLDNAPEGALPPGINVYTKRVISVLKSKT